MLPSPDVAAAVESDKDMKVIRSFSNTDLFKKKGNSRSRALTSEMNIFVVLQTGRRVASGHVGTLTCNRKEMQKRLTCCILYCIPTFTYFM